PDGLNDPRPAPATCSARPAPDRRQTGPCRRPASTLPKGGPRAYHEAMDPRPAPNSDATVDELLDVLDANGLPTGERKARALVHRDGDWHRTVHVWVVRSDGTILVQRRAMEKELEPGRLDVSVGGHLAAGELDVDLVREVEEELGLPVKFGALTYLGTAVTDRAHGGYLDREFQDVYAFQDDTPLE